jgi:hypothetical protein
MLGDGTFPVLSVFFRPSGTDSCFLRLPSAGALGCILLPLCGWDRVAGIQKPAQAELERGTLGLRIDAVWLIVCVFCL